MQRACSLVLNSHGLERTKDLPRRVPRIGRRRRRFPEAVATVTAGRCERVAPSTNLWHYPLHPASLQVLPESTTRDGLLHLCHIVLSRSS